MKEEASLLFRISFTEVALSLQAASELPVINGFWKLTDLFGLRLMRLFLVQILDVVLLRLQNEALRS